ncbi:hypothetical protein [Porphyromonas gingivalis]|uniref:hypothetical protein n=1 Tax=Porphyromonas gingivalis TaxID=837 RepID=UPI001E498E4C|nr:hypothetical protein [Porphyromonas gingivalis]
MRRIFELVEEVSEKVLNRIGVPVNDEKIIGLCLQGVNGIDFSFFVDALYYLEFVAFSLFSHQENTVFRI